MIEQDTPSHAIDGQLKSAAFLGFVLLLIVAAVVGMMQDWRMAAQCLCQSALIWTVAWHLSWQRKALNYDVITAIPFARLGWANRLTLLRGALVAAVGGFLFQPMQVASIVWMPALLYSAAAALDRFDGSIARRSGQTSRLGSELDTAFDALGLAVAPLLAALYGKVHWSYLLVSIAYYLFQGGLHWRRRNARPVYEMTPSKLRRTIAGFQMGFVSLALWPVFQADLTRVASIAFMLPLLTGFAIDWLTVTGRVRPEHAPASDFLRRLAAFSVIVLQPLARITLVALLVWLAYTVNEALAYNGALADDVAWQRVMFVFGLQASAALLATGVLARVGAVAALLLLTWMLPIARIGENGGALSIATAAVAAVFLAAWVALLGAGRFSLWQADDVWVNRHD
ncbi:MAG TPA: CDP-alcohol phosphatidyltransferase family protein [Steroidobacteraceae bacterium]|nr:CDP-alcohol phosphatidyltransferase family protein [Steroidobacteraceae bacterium]